MGNNNKERVYRARDTQSWEPRHGRETNDEAPQLYGLDKPAFMWATIRADRRPV